jgi:tRNA(Ile)-lysidine synthase
VLRNDFVSLIGHSLDAMLLRPEAVGRDTPGLGLVVALSGGPDSVALLLAARAWGERTGRPVAAAHLNHLLRAADAEADVEFCRSLCRRLALTLFEHAADPRPLARARGQGLEEAGRRLRRTFCEDLLVEHPAYGWIAAGHHRDDQVETVLMRLFRGTGPDGMRGIRPVAGAWLHPLLEVDRRDILAFLDEAGQPWRTDVSNLEGDNRRARLRRELLPLARDIFGAGCEEGPARLADLLGEDLDLLAELTRDWVESCVNSDGDLRVPSLLELVPAARARVLRVWLQEKGAADLGRIHIDNVAIWLQDGVSGTSLDLPGDLTLQRDFEVVRLAGTASPAPPLRFAGDYRILVTAGPAGVDPTAAGRREGAGDPSEEGTWALTCPAGILRGNLQIRNWRRGDRLRPFGLQGTKKLSDVLRESRVARPERDNVLVVTDEDGILWVVGVTRTERTRMLPDTTRTVTISVVKRT